MREYLSPDSEAASMKACQLFPNVMWGKDHYIQHPEYNRSEHLTHEM